MMQQPQFSPLPVKEEERDQRQSNQCCYGPGLPDMEDSFAHGNQQKQETAAGKLQAAVYQYRLQSHEKRHEA